MFGPFQAVTVQGGMSGYFRRGGGRENGRL